MDVGDIVYRYEHWADIIEKVKVIEDREDVVKIKSICAVSYDGESITNTYGELYEITDDLFYSSKEAYDAYCAKHGKRIKNYCEQIHTVEDLINFPLKHCIGNGEKYTDHEARHAYIDMAKKLLGIRINETRV